MAEPTRTIYERLAAVQQALKVPKTQRNSFGNYNYRNAEDILEAVKPLLGEHQLALRLSDTIEEIGGRNYVKATAILNDFTSAQIEVTSYARQEDSKKGMDASQLTGSTSSYARKYALNGLFAIDDTKDSDTTNEHDKAEEPFHGVQIPKPSLVTVDDVKDLRDLAKRAGVTTKEEADDLIRRVAGKHVPFIPAADVPNVKAKLEALIVDTLE